MRAQEGLSCDWYCYCYMATLGEPHGTVEISRSKTRPSLKLVQLIKMTLLECFQKQISLLYFSLFFISRK